MQLVPDPRLYRKHWMTLGTVTILLAIAGGIASAIIAIVGKAPDSAIPILWIVIGSVIAAVWIVATPIIYLWIRNLEYRIEPDKIIINKGILTKTQQNIPLRMVTDFRLQRTLYDRWLGIGSILLQTAGQTQNATGYEGKLAGLAGWQGLHERLQMLVLEYDGRVGFDPVSPPPIGLADLAADVHAIRRFLEQATD